MVANHYFGVSFGDQEDAKLVHNVILQVTQMSTLAETFSLPRIQHLMVRRNLAFQSKNSYEKSEKLIDNSKSILQPIR